MDGSAPMGLKERGCGTLEAGLRSQAFEERPAKAGLEEPSQEQNLLAEGPPCDGSAKRHIVPRARRWIFYCLSIKGTIL
jgi:hypothetical protein